MFDSLEFIRRNLNEFFLRDPGRIDPETDGEPIVLDNISNFEEANFEGRNKMVMSLVNIEEESTRKNSKPYQKTNGETEYRNPPVILNLYVLFSANMNSYEMGLRALSRLVAFFQGRNTFSYSEMPVPESRLEGQDRDNLRLIFDLYTLTFEQINHLWGSLGGKQRPFAMYKVRVVPIRYDHLLDAGSVIERVRNDTAG